MFLSKIATRRPVLTLTIVFVFVFFGASAYLSLNLNTYPEVKVPYVSISTIFPGAGAKEVENLVTKKIEDEISTISGIERIESYSLPNFSIILIEFKLDKDINLATIEVKDKVDKLINLLPTDAKKPTVEKIDMQAFPIVDLVVSGNYSPVELYEIADKKIRPRLSQISGVATVEILGGQEREIQIQFENRVVFENAVSLPQFIQLLKANNLEIPAGTFDYNGQEYSVRVKGDYKNLEELKNLRIPTFFGPKKLDQLARVVDTGKTITKKATYFDVKSGEKRKNILRLSVIKATDANAVKVSDEIRKVLPEISQELEGVSIELFRDEANFVRGTFYDTMSNIYLGVVFTGLILFVFLFNWRTTLIVFITMPVSIVSTFLFFKVFGLSLNVLSLMGISVSIGVLVANSVVVLENIIRFKSFGYNSVDASYFGTNEVVVAVLASTLTNIIVFVPIANMYSIVGFFLRDLALAATFATLFSLLFSLTLTPLLSSKLLRVEEKDNYFTRLYHKIDSYFKETYRVLLAMVLKNKTISSLSIAFVFALFILLTITLLPKIGYEFVPMLDNSLVIVDIELPEGSSLQTTAEKVEEIEKKLEKFSEVEEIVTKIGMKNQLSVGSNIARIEVKLVEPSERTKSTSEFIPIILEELSSIPNIKLIVQQQQIIEQMGEPVQFYLRGQDLDTLAKYRELIIEEIKDIPGLINLDDSYRSGKQEIIIVPKREILAEIGLSITELAYTVRSSIVGIESTKYRESGEEFDITLKLEPNEVNTLEKVSNLTVVTPTGIYRLNQLADIQINPAVTKLMRNGKYEAIKFTASNAPQVPLGNITSEIERRVNKINFPKGYSFVWGGTVKYMNEMIRDMLMAFIIATILTYLLLSAILESFVQPIYIMITLPLGLIGVFLFMYAFGVSFNISSLMGVILLIGLVVNNAILILDFTNQLVREKKYDVKSALLEASVTKLKPQIMSTLSLILGMLPMALGLGEFGREVREPLGIVSIGGLLVSTLLTLFIIPAFYYVFAKRK